MKERKKDPNCTQVKRGVLWFWLLVFNDCSFPFTTLRPYVCDCISYLLQIVQSYTYIYIYMSPHKIYEDLGSNFEEI